MKKTALMLGTTSALVLASAMPAMAGTIAGRVTDASETIGLEGAIVRIVETGQTASVGRDGSFRITGLTRGDYTLRVSYIGAEPREITVRLADDDATTSPTITLGDDVARVENILVIGQRGAMNSALNRQRADDGLITVLSSDAIGQFPDENVAEAARRAVGVNVLNDQGEGRFVSVRGADPNMVSTSINGVRLTSPEAEDRQVALDVIDADVLTSVVINKSLLPNMDGDSIGGNVEIETMSGLNTDGLMLRSKIGVLYSDLAQSFGNRFSLNYANAFMDGNLGIAASISHQEREFGSHNMEVDGEWETGESVFFPNELELRDYQVTRERTTATLNFDYRHDNDTSFYLRTMFSDFSDQEYRSRVETKYEDGDYLDALSSGTLAAFSSSEFGVDRDLKNRLEVQRIYAADFGGEHLAGTTSVDWSLSYVHAEEEEPNRLDADFQAEFDSGEIFAVESVNPLSPQLRFGSGPDREAYFDLTRYEADKFELTDGIAQDREIAAQINVRHDFTFSGTAGYVQYGVRVRNRDKKFDLDMAIYEDTFGMTLADFATDVDYDLAPIGRTADPAAVRGFFDANRAGLDFDAGDSLIESQIADYGVEEDVFAGYIMASADFGATRVTGGFRYEGTDVSAYGYELNDISGGINLVQVADDYSDILPSIAVRTEFTENVIGRFAYYESIQRPNPKQFAPRVFIEDDGGDVVGEFGNPDLQRLEAQNFDVSLEWYPNNDSVIYLGYFHKEIENMIGETELNNVTFNGTFFDEADTWINLPSAEISGIEFNYQQDLDFLPVEGFLAGFNFTATDSEATLADGRVIAMPRQSDSVWNAILGYDRGPWDLRAVWSNRSEFLDEIRGGSDEDRIVLEHAQLDLSAKYRFNDHLRIFMEVKNVTDEPYVAVTRPNGADHLEQFEEYGWSTVFGLRMEY